MSRTRAANRSYGELVADTMTKDPGFRAEWERLAPARALANTLLRYRAEHHLTQTELGKRLGVSQPRVAKLESGEHNPDLDTIAKIVHVTGVEFCVDFVPVGQTSKLTTKRAQQTSERSAPYTGVSVISAAA